MTLASLFCAISPCQRRLAMASIGNRASGEGLPRTASRLLDRLPAPPALASPLASSRCALAPGITAASLHAVAAGGRGRIRSSPSLRHQHSAGCAASSRVAASCLRHRSEAQPGGGADAPARAFSVATTVAARPSPCTLGVKTVRRTLATHSNHSGCRLTANRN